MFCKNIENRFIDTYQAVNIGFPGEKGTVRDYY